MSKEGYELTPEDCMGLAAIRSLTAAMADFTKQIGSMQSSDDFSNRAIWLDKFMDRIGATDMLVKMKIQRETYTIGQEVK